MPKRLNPSEFIGKTFHALTVIDQALHKSFKAHFRCRCVCGIIVIVDACNLRDGHSKSCGCLRVITGKGRGYSSRVHGHSLDKTRGAHIGSRTYGSWQAMLQRCSDRGHVAWKYYGGRGISVTKVWRDSFAMFLAEMGERPIGRTLDRIDNRFGYFASNCRWATPKEQANNRRNNRANAGA